MNERIRVLVCDDSLFMRAAVKKLLAKDARIEIIGEAKDGRDAVDKALALRPDVCTMDFNMPNLDGAGAVRAIMAQRPTPIVMVSAHTKEGARETFEAIAAGAVDFVTKPSGEVSAELGAVGAELLAKVIAAAGAKPQAMIAPAAKQARPRLTGPRTIISAGGVSIVGPKVVVVAISTGGPAALAQFLPMLPADTSLAIVVVQHLPAGFTQALAERLDSICEVRVREAKDGDKPEPGLVLVAPGDKHLNVDEHGVLRVVDGPEVNGVRPSADVTMVAAARVYGRRTVGVVMTGMGKDGSDGLRAIKEHGGVTLAQDQLSSVIWGMPRAAVDAGLVDHVVPLAQLAEAVRKA